MPQRGSICAQPDGAGNNCGVCGRARWHCRGAASEESQVPQKCNLKSPVRFRRTQDDKVVSLFHVGVVPGEDAIQPVDEMFFLMEAVWFSRVDDEFGFHSIAF